MILVRAAVAGLLSATVACSAASTHAESTFTVSRLTETLVDAGRPTPANGAVGGHPGRTLLTFVWYPAHARGPFPLIVFAHGFGTPSDLGGYVTLLDRWASAGFVVAAPVFPLTRADAPGGPDLADYVNQPGDMSFVISRLVAASAAGGGPLSGLIDPAEIGAAGHSLGGVTTLGLVANTCCLDRRVKAAIVMSGDAIGFPAGRTDEQAAPPLLFVHGDADEAVPYAATVTAFNEASAPKAVVTIRGGDHGAPVDGRGPAFPTVVKVTIDFFDQYLRHQAAASSRLRVDARSGLTTLALATPGGPPVTLPVPTTVASALRATVSPAQGLHEGQVVLVSWQGFKPGVSVNVLECDRNPPTGPGDCALQSARLLVPDPTGSASVPLTVHTSIPGSGACGTTAPRCVVVVNQGGSTVQSDSVVLPISFSE